MLKSAAAAGVVREWLSASPPLPGWIANLDFFYAANQGEEWIDRTGNGNHGTVSTVGSGGSSSVMHVAGPGAYWQFNSPSSALEQTYVDSGFAPGSIPDTYSSHMIAVVNYQALQAMILKASDSVSNQVYLKAQADNKFFMEYSGTPDFGDATQTVVTSNTYGADTWWLVVTGHGLGAKVIRVNNIIDGQGLSEVNLNISDTFTVGNDEVSNTYPNNFKIAAVGFGSNYAYSTDDLDALYNYYNSEVGLG